MTEHTTASIHFVNSSYCPFLDAQNICIYKNYEWNMYLDKPFDLYSPYKWGNPLSIIINSLSL